MELVEFRRRLELKEWLAEIPHFRRVEENLLTESTHALCLVWNPGRKLPVVGSVVGGEAFRQKQVLSVSQSLHVAQGRSQGSLGYLGPIWRCRESCGGRGLEAE